MQLRLQPSLHFQSVLGTNDRGNRPASSPWAPPPPTTTEAHTVLIAAASIPAARLRLLQLPLPQALMLSRYPSASYCLAAVSLPRPLTSLHCLAIPARAPLGSSPPTFPHHPAAAIFQYYRSPTLRNPTAIRCGYIGTRFTLPLISSRRGLARRLSIYKRVLLVYSYESSERARGTSSAWRQI